METTRSTAVSGSSANADAIEADDPVVQQMRFFEEDRRSAVACSGLFGPDPDPLPEAGQGGS
jgi:hypothetical protein